METLTEIRECILEANRVNETNYLVRMCVQAYHKGLLNRLLIPWIDCRVQINAVPVHLYDINEWDDTTKVAILKSVISDVTGVDFKNLKCRKRELAQSRQMLAYLLNKCTNMSLNEIGAHLGGKHHSTIIHSIETVHNLMEWDKQFNKEIKKVAELVSIEL